MSDADHAESRPSSLRSRRTVLTAGAGLAVIAGGSARSLLPGRQDPSSAPSQAAPSTPAENSAAPAGSAEWVRTDDLEGVDPDGDALDAAAGLIPGSAVRSDRYGSWMTPDFTPDSPVRTAPPSAADEGAVQRLLQDPAQADATAANVRLAMITALLDAQTAFEADDSRLGEDAASLAQALGLQMADPNQLTEILRPAGLSGIPGSTVEEYLGAEPAPNDPTRHRFHLLGHGTQIVPLTTVPDGASMIMTCARGLFPGMRGEQSVHLEREIGLGFGQAGNQVIFSLTSGVRAVLFIADPLALPEVEALEPGQDWTAIEIPGARAMLPPGYAVTSPIQFGSGFAGDAGEQGTLMRQLEPAPELLSLPLGSFAARVPLEGADLAVATATDQGDGTWVIALRAQRTEDLLDMRATMAATDAAEVEDVLRRFAGGLDLSA